MRLTEESGRQRDGGTRDGGGAAEFEREKEEAEVEAEEAEEDEITRCICEGQVFM